MNQSCSVVVLAAGRGTRMKSALPKVLHSLCGRTLLGHALKAAEGIGPNNIVAVVRHERDQVAAEATKVIPTIAIADQDEIPGTGRAVYCGLEEAKKRGMALGNTVVVTSGDVPLLETATLQKLVTDHQKNRAAVTVVSTISDNPTGYGRIIRGQEAQQIAKIVEHKDATLEELETAEINAGIYAFDTAFLEEALGHLDQGNSQGEVYLTDTVELATKQGRLAQAFVLVDQWQAEGCNDLSQLATLRQVLNQRLCQKHMLAGVSIVDPQSTGIDVEVIIAPDARIEPSTELRGQTRIETGAIVGPGSTVINSILEEKSVTSHCVVVDSVVQTAESLPQFTVRQGNLTS